MMASRGMGAIMPSKKGAVKTAAPSRDGVATKGKTKGKQIKMAKGGMMHGGKVHKYAKGGSIGSASRRGDGIAMRGKTRGKMF